MHPNFVNSSSKYLVTTGEFLFVICRKGSRGTVRGLPGRERVAVILIVSCVEAHRAQPLQGRGGVGHGDRIRESERQVC